jgi:iron complex transport system ATP-binding protein
LSVRLGSRPALAGIDLAVQPGSFTVVIGPNGAGKTTLLRALAGLIAPSAGSVVLGETSVARLSGIERARSIAYLPQNGTVAWPLPVTGVVALGRLPHGEMPDRLPIRGRDAVTRAIHAVGLQGFETRAVTELSGGERARVLLARALATQAPVLLVDEPVAALDPRYQLIVLDGLRAEAQAGAIVIAVMHDLSLAARFADSLVLMMEGRLLASGAPSDVLTRTNLTRGFGVEAVVRIEKDRPFVIVERALTIDE